MELSLHSLFMRVVSAADNRKIPPLKYEFVRKLTDEFPDLDFVLNGGICSLTQTNEELEWCHSLERSWLGGHSLQILRAFQWPMSYCLLIIKDNYALVV